jgi:hypothetical protein
MARVCRGIAHVMSCSSVDTIEIVTTSGLQVTQHIQGNAYFNTEIIDMYLISNPLGVVQLHTITTVSLPISINEILFSSMEHGIDLQNVRIS